MNQRQSDERMLSILRRASGGETLTAIAASLGMTSESVRIMARRVVLADLSESGEPESAVRAGYPWRRA